MTDRELWNAALDAAQNAYAPYSRFRVGAALLAQDGSVYTGVNIENASFGATVCAERTALFHAVKEGKRSFLMLAVAAIGADGTVTAAPPCGICRQTLLEFCAPEMPVLFGAAEKIQKVAIGDLLPFTFQL